LELERESKNQIRFDNVFWNTVDHKTKPKPLGFDAICTQARLQKVLFLTKTKLKPKKNNQYQNTKSEHFAPGLMPN
jgi:hypothetical protein